MDEATWLASEDVGAMLGWLTAVPGYANDLSSPRVSPRKLRLFACACCRQVWHLLTDRRSCRAVEVAERYADGLATREELYAAWNLASEAIEIGPPPPAKEFNLRHAAQVTAREDAQDILDGLSVAYTRWHPVVPPALQAALLREVAGNPWRPVKLPRPKCRICNGHGGWEDYEEGQWVEHKDCNGMGDLPCPWITPTVLALAQAAYAERPGRACETCGGKKRLPYWDKDGDREGTPCWRWRGCPDCGGTGRVEDGSLDPQRLAVLSDALEEAGCDSEDILSHLRGQERFIPVDEEKRKRLLKSGLRVLCAKGCCFECEACSAKPGSPTLCKNCLELRALCARTADGWRPLRGPHVRGCWALDLILGKE